MGNSKKRNHKRWYCKGPIWLTHFNKNNLIEAKTLNFCLGGMCFKDCELLQAIQNIQHAFKEDLIVSGIGYNEPDRFTFGVLTATSLYVFN